MKVFIVLAAIVALFACKARTNDSMVREVPGGDGEPSDGIQMWDHEATLGMWDEARPVVTRIIVQEGEEPIAQDWDAPGGNEYWLSSRGAMTFSDTGDYKKYQGTCEESNTCGIKPDEYARRCMWQAGKTLKAIMENPPAEWTDHPNKPSLFGWLDESHSWPFYDQERTQPAGSPRYAGPWKWNNYMKWRGSLSPDGICTTPSLGEFKAFMRTFPHTR